MNQLHETRNPATLAQRAIAGGVGEVGGGRAGGADGQSGSPCDILQRLAQTIQLMRLDPADAHIYRDGCDGLVQRVIAVSKWSRLPQALAQIMHLVEQRDYRWALVELRAIMQPEWHTC
jgi:hypothetical protein